MINHELNLEANESVEYIIRRSAGRYWSAVLFRGAAKWLAGLILITAILLLSQLFFLLVSQRFNSNLAIGSGIVLVVLLVLYAIRVVITYVKEPLSVWNQVQYFVTNRRLISHDPELITSIQYDDIENVNYSVPSFLANLLNYGDLMLTSHSTDEMVHLLHIENPAARNRN